MKERNVFTSLNLLSLMERNSRLGQSFSTSSPLLSRFSLMSSFLRLGSLGKSLTWVREESLRSSSSSLPNSSVRPSHSPPVLQPDRSRLVQAALSSPRSSSVILFSILHQCPDSLKEG